MAIKALLVANRGEIACRIMRSAKARGIRCIAIHSEADAEALHVATADDAVLLPGNRANETYLNRAAILEAAARTGADAIHPGYGFLAEHAGFAEEVEAKGLIWIGPNAGTIRRMGDKHAARETARNSGVPILPGTAPFTAAEIRAATAAAHEIGFPLLVKAVAGGGGIGMQKISSAEELERRLPNIANLAEKAFGCGDVYLEHLVERGRHIEIQVAGDGHGGGVHFFERECSLQRRYQKVVEEAPAISVPDHVRADMRAVSVNLVKSIHYRGVGTVELIYDENRQEYFFLEMNTRIQVEHPVTEEITGADLVDLQLDIAERGAAALPDQETITQSGHSIECRVYAEDPTRKFLPSPGKIEVLTLPADMAGVRVETGYRSGDTVTPFYDPMIAKLIVTAESREAALAQMAKLLERCRVSGIKTNLGFLEELIAHPAIGRNDVSTRFLEENADALILAMSAASADT